mmetsp:Transcript_41086/g.62199  ORF Transcript_41086/g.62199 Transcript_41086/m.62199 type:complete len:160 (+) Transcript_41086:1153-1632(+)
MAFIAPTGLTLAFISGLFRFCTVQNVPFFPIYAWVGIWTSIFMVTLGAAGSSKLIRYCTRFTDEVFNALLSMNFIYEALASLRRNFLLVADPMNLSMPFVSLAMAIGTFWSTVKVTTMEQTCLDLCRLVLCLLVVGTFSFLSDLFQSQRASCVPCQQFC